MPVLFTYLLKLSVALSVVYFFYAVALRRLTFYNWNRWYLLVYTALCFLFPLIDISALFSAAETGSNHMIYLVPALSDFNKQVITADSTTDFYSTWNLIAIVLISGMLFLLVRLFVQLYSYRTMRRKASLISKAGIGVYETNLSTVPFSFGRSVFINPAQHTEEELAEIIRHEFVHVKQAHTIDVIWGELFCMVNWFNPFAWLLRKAIRQNLEFIADDKVLQEGIDKKQYQYLLLKVTGNKQFRIAHSFNFSSLKKRIAMMNKSKTAKLQLIRFLFLLPVVVVLLLVFRKESVAQTDLSENESSGFLGMYFKRSPDSSLIHYPKNVKHVSIKEDVVTVLLQNGKEEEYDLSNKEQEKNFKNKYSNVPYRTVEVDSIFGAPYKQVKPDSRTQESIGSQSSSKSPLSDTAGLDYINSKGNIITILQDKVVVVMDKNRKVQKSIFLTEWMSKKEHYTKMYGELPNPKITRADNPRVRQFVQQEVEKRILLEQQRIKTEREKEKVPAPSKTSPPAKPSKVSSPSAPAKVSEPSSFSAEGEISFSLKGGNGQPISYSDPYENRKRLNIDKAIVTAESISVTSKNHSLNLQGEASFKNSDGVAMYATTIQLSLKEFSGLPYVLIDDKELDWDKDYSSNYKQTYEVSFLKKEDAIRKYGAKGKEGALEITSL